MLHIWKPALPLLLVAACQAEDPGPTVHVEGTGFAADDGAMVSLALVRTDPPTILDVATVAVEDGVIAVDLQDRGLEFARTRIDAFVDVDGNGVCEFGIDQTFAFDLDPLAADINLGFSPASAGDSRGCLAFGGATISLTGRGFVADKGLHAALIRATDDVVLGVQHIVTEDGAFELSWPGGARANTFYRIDWFVDANASSTCDVAPAEGPWRVDFGAIGGDFDATGLTGGELSTEVEGDDAAEPEACATFPDGVSRRVRTSEP